MSRASERWRRSAVTIAVGLVKVGVRTAVTNLLAVATVAFAMVGWTAAAATLGLAILVAALSYVGLALLWRPEARALVRGRVQGATTGAFTLARTLVALALPGLAMAAGHPRGVAWALGAVLAALIVAEPIVARISATWDPYAAHVPWSSVDARPTIGLASIYLANTLLVGVSLVALGLGASPWVLAPAVVVPLALMALVVVQARSQVRRRRSFEGRLTRDLTEYAPEFLLYWDAPAGTAYQVGMWLPFLDQIGARYVVVVRTVVNLEEVRPLTSAPVILRAAMAELDDVVVPSLRVAFYVNNAIRNCHFVRFPGMTHIQLNHGDSDKAPSFNPVMRMYDKNFVAGQAAVDRFAAHGVATRPDFFEIVGRPQVGRVQVSTHADREAGPRTVLYAPTWAGFMADSNYSSLPVGPALVRALVARGHRVIFRPHPHARNTPALARACAEIEQILAQDTAATGTAHLVGPAAETAMSVFDGFDASDAMISDVSSVVPDYLYSEKPMALVAMNTTYADFMRDNPIASAAYVIDQQLTNLDPVLDDLLGADSMRAQRVSVKAYYLGDFPADGYVDAFLTQARRYLGR